MKEILLTSSVLIAALFLLRRVFRKSISRRAQYALWALVLLRLLIPFNLPNIEHNVLAAAEPVSRELRSQAIYIQPSSTTIIRPEGTEGPHPFDDDPNMTLGPASQDNTYTFTDKYQNDHIVEYQRQITLSDLLLIAERILRPVWYGGMALMALWFLLSNLLFWMKLRKHRTPFPVENCPYRVYLVEAGLPSPCLFGLFRPAVYLTPAAASSPESLRHVLAHEETHARHLDPLWSLLRAVCLTVYWFDPLVWAAAVASRNDCELACDEGAIRALGEEERIAYGKTLLSLIPLRRGPSNPLLSATTMTAGKKQLKDRVTRIAENRRTVGAALFAVIALTALVCAATFTEPAGGTDQADGPLTVEELQFFDQQFFNGEDFNIRNQFLSSTYETPEDINLYLLFYNGTGLPAVPSEEERQAVSQAGYGGEDPGVDLTKCPAADMDAVLLQNTGLSLSATNQVHLDSFTYLGEYEAYYHFHGDTNYQSQVDIIAGERSGGLVRLYYEDTFLPDGWKCVTLREAGGGEYHFVSHLPCAQPAVPTVYPAGEPWMTIPLSGLTPYEPQAAAVEHHAWDEAEHILYRFSIDESGTYDPEAQTVTDARMLAVYRTTGGAVCAAVENEGLDCFFTFPENVSPEYASEHISAFRGLFGHSGAVISYKAQKDGEYYTTFNDFYTVDSSGTPYLLARAYGEDCRQIDLDGDGTWELASAGVHDAQIFFQRDGQLYEAQIPALLAERWTDPVSLYPAYWNKYSRCLYLSGEVPFPGALLPEDFGGGQATGTAVRQVYFDGENLLLYKDGDRPVADHVIQGIDVPEDVLDAARTMVHDRYEYARSHTGVIAGDGGMMGTPAEYDDWRLEILGGPYPEEIGGAAYEIWNINYEFHTTTPERVILAGGSYLTEDAWHCNTYPGCTYLYFQLLEDGSRRYLYSAMENDCGPGSELFRTDMVYRLEGLGLLSLTDVEGPLLADMFLMQETDFLNSMAERTDGEAVVDHLRNYLISVYGSALDGLIEGNIASGGQSSGLSHEELEQYYLRSFEKMRGDLSQGGLALWERLTEAGASAPAGQLLPTLADIEALTPGPAEVAEVIYQLGKANLAEFLQMEALYDGWRVSELNRPRRFNIYGLTLDVYSVWFELHPSRPDKVALAGGMDFTEDGWVQGLMAYSPYLLFLQEDGQSTLLESDIAFDYGIESIGFQADLASVLLQNGLITPSQVEGDTLLSMLGPWALNLWGTFQEAEQEAVITALDAFHNKGTQAQQTDLRDAIQTTVWAQRNLDEHGSALFAKLLERTGIHAYGIGGSYSDLTSAIYASLRYWRQNASAHKSDHHSVAYHLLDTQWGGCGCTVYLLVSFGDYELTEEGYQLGSAGSCNAMALSFAHVNGLYQLTEIWQPHGGGLYEPEIRACFPEAAADTVFSQDSETYESIAEALNSYLDMDVKAWYASLQTPQAGQ